MRSVPQWVLTRHGGDQLRDLGVQARSAQRTAGTPAPEGAPTLAVPAQHGLGSDQEEVASPVPVEAAEREPEELVANAQAGPVLGAECDLEQLAEEQVLEEETLAAAESVSKGSQEESEEFDHPRQDRRSSPPPPGPARLLPPYSCWASRICGGRRAEHPAGSHRLDSGHGRGANVGSQARAGRVAGAACCGLL